MLFVTTLVILVYDLKLSHLGSQVVVSDFITFHELVTNVSPYSSRRRCWSALGQTTFNSDEHDNRY